MGRPVRFRFFPKRTRDLTSLIRHSQDHVL